MIEPQQQQKKTQQDRIQFSSKITIFIYIYRLGKYERISISKHLLISL